MNYLKKRKSQIFETKKEGRPLKDVVPPIPNKAPREPIILPPVDNFDRNYKCESEPYIPFSEWPGDDVANVINFPFNIKLLYIIY